MDTVTDYLADAPSYTAWAGDGTAANRILRRRAAARSE